VQEGCQETKGKAGLSWSEKRGKKVIGNAEIAEILRQSVRGRNVEKVWSAAKMDQYAEQNGSEMRERRAFGGCLSGMRQGGDSEHV